MASRKSNKPIGAKKSFKKKDPLEVRVLSEYELRSMDSAVVYQLKHLQMNAKVEAHMAMLGYVDLKMRTLVAGLFESQIALLDHIERLLYVMEDPSVAHAVKVKEQIDQLTSKVEELSDNFNTHERNNEHTSSDY